ncbi:MAG: CDP-6-deoxy-delta-3,4-glucoseen reductase [Methylophilaceae bacterium]
MSFQVTLQPSGHSFPASPDDTVLKAALDAGYTLPYGCRNGACGSCKGSIISGTVEYPDIQPQALTVVDVAAGKALFCCAQATSDLLIECREVAAKDDIAPRILPCRVEKKVQLTHDVMALYLKLPANERLQFMAGQYVEFLLKDGSRRAFSLANAPFDDGMLEIHARLIPDGTFTKYVFNEMPEKAIMRIEGPLGTFYLREDSEKPIIFVAGGTGFAPIKGMIEHALHHGSKRSMVLYWGALTKRDLYMPELPEKWAAEHANVKFIPVLSDPVPQDDWAGRTGFVHHAVMADYPDLSAYEVYCCGAPGMVESAYIDFVARGLPEHEFFSDAFTYAPKPKLATAPL